MASLYPRGKFIWIKYSVNGKVNRESLKLPNDKKGWEQAKIILHEREAELRRKQFFSASKNVYLSDGFAEFLEHKTLRVLDANLYECAYKALCTYLGKDIPARSLKEDDFINFKNSLEKQKSYNTVVTYFNHLREFFVYLKIQKQIDIVPVPKLKRIQYPIIVIPDKHFNIILKHLKNRNLTYYYLIKFFHDSGFRRNEALNLKWSEIHFDRNIIDVWNQKEQRYDVFPLLKNIRIILSKIKKDHERVFPIEVRALDFFPRMIKELKLPKKYTIKSLRSTFGSNMAKIIMPYKLMKLMRHKDIDTTMRYYVDVEMSGIIDEIERAS